MFQNRLVSRSARCAHPKMRPEYSGLPLASCRLRLVTSAQRPRSPSKGSHELTGISERIARIGLARAPDTPSRCDPQPPHRPLVALIPPDEKTQHPGPCPAETDDAPPRAEQLDPLQPGLGRLGTATMEDQPPVAVELKPHDGFRITLVDDRPDLPRTPSKYQPADRDRGPCREPGQPGARGRAKMDNPQHQRKGARGSQFSVDDDRPGHGPAQCARGGHYNRPHSRPPQNPAPSTRNP